VSTDASATPQLTPTRLQEIRQDRDGIKAMNAFASNLMLEVAEKDLTDLLTLWDTHQTALRALVEQWKRDLAEVDAPVRPADMFGAAAGRRQVLSVQVVGLSRAMRELERLLTPEQTQEQK